MDAFLSHSSRDMDVAIRIEQGLTAEGVTVWLDRDNIRAGGLLVEKLQTALLDSQNIVVLWSSASATSPWVTTEWTSVVNLNHQRTTTTSKGIIPCLLDDTPLALFLLNYVFVDFRPSFDDALAQVLQALKGARREETPPPTPFKPSDFVVEIYGRQDAILAALTTRNVPQAKRLQDELTPIVDNALRAFPDDYYLVTLAGYDLKNQYMIRHWDEIQAGQSPKDSLLDRSMQVFLKALSIRPDDPSALNGMGSVFIMRRDLDAAEFYIQRALARAKEEQLDYGAAEHDLALVRQLKKSRTEKRRKRRSSVRP